MQGEFLWGSNYTFLTQVADAEMNLQAVYKPIRGERPLWDFPSASLARREVAAYLVSEALGWSNVPPTIYREHGPLGPGSLQLFVIHNPDYHYFNFRREDRERLRSVALFDYIINNADRKGSHFLIDSQGNLWLIDHGLCFHEENKLRTVVWEFAGELIPEHLCLDLVRFGDQLRQKDDRPSQLAMTLVEYISFAEIKSILQRVDHLDAGGHFPQPNPHRRHHPWPQL